MSATPQYPQFDTASVRPRLLIADDDPVARSALSIQLGADFELVGTAKDAEEAIAVAEQQEPDVAIIDVQMPAGGGLRATREIHARVPHTAIVILSIDEQHESVVELLNAGAMSYCRKGIPAHELTANLQMAIAAHARQASPEQAPPAET